MSDMRRRQFITLLGVRHTEKSSGRKRPLRGGFPPSP
jgi:hypothetical protein